MKGFWDLKICCLLIVLFILSSCDNGVVHEKERVAVDSLNELSYVNHYKSLDETERLAKEALQLAEKAKYEDGVNEARCNLGFVEYMRMDYLAAQETFEKVRTESRNQLLCMVADVGVMRVCQRRSNNKDFYVYRNSAMERMERIRPEMRMMTVHQRGLWNFAMSDFYLIQSIYFYYLRQEDEVKKAFQAISNNMDWVRADTAQLTWFYFLGGNTKNIDNQLGDDDMQNILRCVTLSQEHGYKYLRSKAFSTIAEDIVNAKKMRPSREVYLRELLTVPDTLTRMALSFSLANQALKDFTEYGSLFDVSQTHIMLSEYYLAVNQKEKALEELKKALACVEKAHQQPLRSPLPSSPRGGEFHPDSFPPPRGSWRGAEEDGRGLGLLTPEGTPVNVLVNDSVVHSHEMEWILKREVCLPEWMADVREHLSIVYSALGMKEESDNNRNIYLDILDATRQDQRMEQHLETLKKEEAQLNRMMLIVGVLGVALIALVLGLSRRMRRKYKEDYAREMQSVEQEMASWRAKTDKDFSSLEDIEEDVKEERFGFEHRIEEQKKQYIDKMTSLSIVYSITPFLDRAVNEIKKIDTDKDEPIGDLTRERLSYMSELTDRINLYNDVLTHWIKIRQGAVSLNIESFELGELFELLSKRVNVFKNKNLDLQVRLTNSVVKADKALTLFMMNTLLENARKYTPEGGQVELYAEDTDKYVEVSVKDTGKGLSEEDVRQILGEKVYDSSKIGDVEHDEELRRSKGFGFGLMNCKGIIDKYKKSNAIFSVCLFSIESKLGKGSRFFFRLPKGKLRMILALALALACHPNGIANAHANTIPELQRAHEFADSIYYSNVYGFHEDALAFVDSACAHLNAYYLKQNPEGKLLLHLYEVDCMPEIDLWMSGFKTDYHTILDIRNEAAIAALATNRWDVYYYNNEIYIRLYKLLGQDYTLEKYCNDIKAANTNRQTVLILVGILMLIGLLAYFFFYYYNHILPTFNLRQILELNRKIFTLKDESVLAQIIKDGLHEIKRTEGVALLLNDGVTQFSASCPQRDNLLQFMQLCMKEQKEAIYDSGKVRVFPLIMKETDSSEHSLKHEETLPDGKENEHLIGAMAVVLHDGSQQKGEYQLFQLIANYVAINFYYSQVRMERIRTQIEMAEDESRRAEHEANAVHVQNMVLDNCLSTIKHETMYYPNRIKQLLNNLLDEEGGRQNSEQMHEVKELMLYYKEIYTILSNCAGRQMETVLFKRRVMPVEDLVEYATRSLARQNKKLKLNVQLECEGTNGLQLVADKAMIEYLFDHLISFFLQYKKDGTVRLNFAKSEDFVKFAVSFDGVDLSAKQFHTFFYPENMSYDSTTDTLTGAQMLVAKQIIREHDEHVRRGCRINAEPAIAETGKGICICFTIPEKTNQGF